MKNPYAGTLAYHKARVQPPSGSCLQPLFVNHRKKRVTRIAQAAWCLQCYKHETRREFDMSIVSLDHPATPRLRPPARYYFRASLQRPSAALGVALPHLLRRFDWLAKLILCCQHAVQKLSAPTARKNAIEACFGQGHSAKQRPPTWSTKFVTGTGLDRCALLRTDVAPYHWGAFPALLHVTLATMAADLRPSWAESRTPYKIHTFAT